MLVVIDTNVFVSSFFGGNPKKVIDLWKNGNVILCLSKEIINEYIEVLVRLKVDKKNLKELVQLFSNSPNVIFTATTKKLHIVEKDPDDDKFIECAVELGAEFIVTGDKALLEVRQYGLIKILNPKDFLEIMRNY
jgi:hypothetical protein